MTMKLINLMILLLLSAVSMADEWVWAPDQPVGATLPNFTVTALDGSKATLDALAGDKGTLLMFSRSTVW